MRKILLPALLVTVLAACGESPTEPVRAPSVQFDGDPGQPGDPCDPITYSGPYECIAMPDGGAYALAD